MGTTRNIVEAFVDDTTIFKANITKGYTSRWLKKFNFKTWFSQIKDIDRLIKEKFEKFRMLLKRDWNTNIFFLRGNNSWYLD